MQYYRDRATPSSSKSLHIQRQSSLLPDVDHLVPVDIVLQHTPLCLVGLRVVADTRRMEAAAVIAETVGTVSIIGYISNIYFNEKYAQNILK